MVREAPRLSVHYAELAQRQLKEIWNWNAERYDSDHADKYIAFLRSSADRLATEHQSGQKVPGRDDYRYVVIRRRTKGNAHLAIYTVTATTVEVLGFYHSSQDWQGKVERGEG